MKKKTINAVLNKKFDDFLNSITDEKVRNLVSENTIITGGCIASMLLKEKVNDYDIYFTNKETTEAVANYYVNKFNEKQEIKFKDDPLKIVRVEVLVEKERVKIFIKSAGVASETKSDGYEYFENREQDVVDEYLDQVVQSLKTEEELDVSNEAKTIAIDKEQGTFTTTNKEKYRPIFLSENAITLSNDVQIVVRFYGDPEKIHQHYDYLHCTNYWLSKDRKVHLNQPALESLMARELIYVGSKYPICSVIRSRKFIKRGWTINAGQYLKMCFQISELNLKDINVLKDQLTGVDVAYFYQLVSALQKQEAKEKEDGKTFELNYGYLVTIIDKIF